MTATLPFVVQIFGTVHAKVRTPAPNAGSAGSPLGAILNGNVTPPSVDRERSKPLTVAANSGGTVQVMLICCPNLSAPPVGLVRVATTVASAIVKFALLSSCAVALPLSVAITRILPCVVLKPTGTVHVNFRAVPATLGAIVKLKLVPPLVESCTSNF